jgi:hypothetical protein
MTLPHYGATTRQVSTKYPQMRPHLLSKRACIAVGPIVADIRCDFAPSYCIARSVREGRNATPCPTSAAMLPFFSEFSI